MLKKFVKNKKGFTLIELVIVVAILGVLALLVVPNVVNRKNEAEEAVINANIKVINNAIKMYYFEQGDYPDTNDFTNLVEELEEKKYLDSNEAQNAISSLKGKVTVVVDNGKATGIKRTTESSQSGSGQQGSGQSGSSEQNVN